MANINKTIILLSLGVSLCLKASAQKEIPVINASGNQSTIYDGMIKTPWSLDPKLKRDVYYVNVPRRKGKVTLVTDQGKISFKTTYGHDYDLVVLLNGTDSCHVRISAKDDPATKATRRVFPRYHTIYFNGIKDISARLT